MAPPARFNTEGASFSDPTLALDALLPCDLADPGVVALAGTGDSFAERVFSGRASVVAREGTPWEGVVRAKG